MSQSLDVHQATTDQIIEAIDRCTRELKVPWHRPTGSLTRPVNIQSGKAYRGINVVTLWGEAQIKSYAKPGPTCPVFGSSSLPLLTRLNPHHEAET